MKKKLIIFISLLSLMVGCIIISNCNNQETSPPKQKYTKHELQVLENKIMRSILKLKHIPVQAIGINETEHCIELSVYRHEIENLESQKSLGILQGMYGSALKIEYWDPWVRIELANRTNTSLTGSTIPLLLLTAVLLFYVVLYYGAKHAQSLQLVTPAGQVWSRSTPLTVIQVKKLVSKSLLPVPSKLEEQIWNEIEWDHSSY